MENKAAHSLIQITKLMEEELNKEERYDLIEDYIFNQDNYLNEGSGGFKIKQFEDEQVSGVFKINDFVWVEDKEISRYVVALSRLPSKYQDSYLDEYGDYILNVYEKEKLVNTLKSRSEILRLCVGKRTNGDMTSNRMRKDREDDENTGIVYGGLKNGRVAVWNIFGKKKRPETLSRPHLKSNFLAIVHLGTKHCFYMYPSII